MVGSKVTRFAAACEVDVVVVVAPIAINQPHPPPQEGVANPVAEILLHPDIL